MASAVFCCPFKYFSKSRLYHLVDNLPVCATAIYLAQRRGAQSSHRHPQRSRRCPRHPGLLPEGFPCFPAAFLQLSCCFSSGHIALCSNACPQLHPQRSLSTLTAGSWRLQEGGHGAPGMAWPAACPHHGLHTSWPTHNTACPQHGLPPVRPAHNMACPHYGLPPLWPVPIMA